LGDEDRILILDDLAEENGFFVADFPRITFKFNASWVVYISG
jgi:hypothetical protein